MRLTELRSQFDASQAGEEMHRFMTRLYPIPRSITGEGIRETFRLIGERIPLRTVRVPTGEPVFDWEVPPEWRVDAAYLVSPTGERVADFAQSSLRLVAYSRPVRDKLPLTELRKHLHTVPEHPDWIPFRTSYYKESWGFCLSQKELDALVDGEYEVVVDSRLGPGHLEYAECLIEGESEDEILVSTHACHPALCNDNLSGIVLATTLAGIVGEASPRFTYRFIFLPAIIGSIAWLSRNEDAAKRTRAGLVVACVGDGGAFRYKRSRRGDSVIDRAAEHVLSTSGHPNRVVDFYPYGYDERNYCSPGFDLPVGSLTRSSHGEFPEYHTSADNLDFVRPEFLAESLDVYARVLEVIENDGVFVNQNPKCEPQLGRRGLYDGPGGGREDKTREMAMFWLLNMCDGVHSLLDIAERSGIRFDVLTHEGRRLFDAGLLAPGR